MDPGALTAPILSQWGAVGAILIGVVVALIFVFRVWQAEVRENRTFQAQVHRDHLELHKQNIEVIQQNIQSRREAIDSNDRNTAAVESLKDVVEAMLGKFNAERDVVSALEKIIGRWESRK